MQRKFMKFRNYRIITLFFFVTVVISSAVPHAAWAKSSGITGYSGKSGSICTACHSGGTTPTVTITGPTSLSTGSSGVYTVTITGGAAAVGGFDAATSSGTLQATGAGTKLSSGEVVHSAAKSFTGGSCSFTFTLVAPATAGSVTLYAAGLSANGNGSTSGDNAAAATLAVTVSAPPAATAPQIAITDSVAPATDLQIPFGSVASGITSNQTITVSNSGNANLVIGTIAGANPLAAPFSITADTCSGQTVAPGGSCGLTVRFAPTAAGSFSDTFDIPSNDGSTPSATVSLTGTGTAPSSTAQIVITDAVAPANDLQIPFGTVSDGLTSDQTFTVSNGGSASLVIGTIASANGVATPFSITTDNCSGKTISAAGSCTVTLRFAPTASGAFSDTFDIPSNDPATPSAVVTVSGTGDTPPDAPTLVSPADGQSGLGTSVTLEWNKSTDADNDAITYHVYSCTDSTFTSCAPVDVAFLRRPGVYFAASGLLFFGFVFSGGKRRRNMVLLLMITLLLVSGGIFAACGGGGSSTAVPTTDTTVTHTVTGLNSATTYYWKVVADDGKGGLTSSPTWSFKTQ